MDRRSTRADPSSVRRWNEYAVVQSLRTRGPQRITQLVSSTGLSQATLAEVMRGVAAKGWAEVGAARASGPGRPSQVFSARIPSGYVLGIDVGIHTVRGVLSDLAGAPLMHIERAVPTGPVGRDSSPAHEVVADVVAECTKGVDDVWVTSLAVPGTVDDGGQLTRSMSFPAWEGRRPGDILQAQIRGHAMTSNDVIAALWAEHEAGVARGHGDVVQIQLGRRPSMAMLMGGAPHRGVHFIAGDLSMSTLIPAEDSLDWLDDFQAARDPLREAVRAALAGDEAVQDGARDYVLQIARALALAATLVDPSLVVIGGALTPLAAYFEDDLRSYLESHVQIAPAMGISQLDQFASAHGAALLATRDILSSLADPTTGLRPFTRAAYAESAAS